MHYGENNVNTGPLRDLEDICIDRFHGDDLNSKCFFLSHIHTDHMVGLDTSAFVKRLNEPGVKLYCHPLSPPLLRHWNTYLDGADGIDRFVKLGKIIPLDVNRPYDIQITKHGSPCTVSVTLLPAGHCPGSVMFFFETSQRKILYTADFRLNVQDVERMDHLHVGSGGLRPVKAIDRLYVDTTFCCKTAEDFPDRKHALEEAINLIGNYISKPAHAVKLSFAARFAHEFVLQEIYRKFKVQVHVDTDKFDVYQLVPGLGHCVSSDSNTPIHLCQTKDCYLGKQMTEFRFASMWYAAEHLQTRSWVSVSKGRVKVCYAMHSCLKEVAALIDYLKPNIVIPLVLPVKTDLAEVGCLLEKHCKWKFNFVTDAARSSMDLPKKRVPASPLKIEPKKPKMDEQEWDIPLTPPSNSYSSGSSLDGSQERAG